MNNGTKSIAREIEVMKKSFDKLLSVVSDLKIKDGPEEQERPQLPWTVTAQMNHEPTLPFPKLEMAYCKAKDTVERIQIAKRLLVAYNKALEDSHQQRNIRVGNDTMWGEELPLQLQALADVVHKNNPEHLAKFLLSYHESFAPYGGVTLGLDGLTPYDSPQLTALVYHDRLVSLAESIGAIPTQHLGQGGRISQLSEEPARLITLIKNIVSNIEITPPQGSTFSIGLLASGEVFHYRHFENLYAALRIRELVGELEPVLEIGGGLGIAAMYSYRLGVKDYTLIDLPIVNLLAGEYLLNSMPPDTVCLYGEEKAAAIKVLPFWEIKKFPAKRYALAFNQDSMPELDERLARDYVSEIGRIASKYFLSINHENFFPKTVHNYVRKESTFKKVYRSKAWLQPSWYLEELWALTPD
jgi:hypothetical protein